MFRIIDLSALVILSVVVLLPKPGVKPKLAYGGVDEAIRTRAALLEAERARRAGDVGVAVELADAYMRARRPEWALQTLAPLAASADHRVGLGMAVAHADRYEFPEAKRALDAAIAACPRDPGCSEPAQARIELLRRGFDRIAAEGLTFEKDPHRVRDLIIEGLHNTKLPPAPTP